jgi:hypothetical protein
MKSEKNNRKIIIREKEGALCLGAAGKSKATLNNYF